VDLTETLKNVLPKSTLNLSYIVIPTKDIDKESPKKTESLLEIGLIANYSSKIEPSENTYTSLQLLSMPTEKRKTSSELDIIKEEKKPTDIPDSELWLIGIPEMLKSKLTPESQPLLTVVIMIVLLVTDIKFVKYAEEDNSHNTKNASKDAEEVGIKTEKSVPDVKNTVLNAETEKIAKNVPEEKSSKLEIVFLLAQDIGKTEVEFVEKMLGELVC